MSVIAIRKNMILQNMHSLKDINLFGRGQDCDIIIPEEYISRKHFIIESESENYFISNLSKKSIKLNRELLKDRVKLNHNDIIEIGNYELIFLQTFQEEEHRDTFDYRYQKNQNSTEFYILYVVKERVPSFYLFKSSFKNFINGYLVEFKENLLYIDNESFEIKETPFKYEYLDTKFELFKNDDRGFFKYHPFYGFYTQSESLINQFFKVWISSQSDFPIFLHGDTGSGKDVMANSIHKISKREGDFVAINCSSIPENLWESELFGHKKGAFTGAEFEKKGAFQLAHNGTIFLDEIAEMPLDQQAKLLRVLEDKKVKMVGAEKYEKVNVRIISATHKNIFKLIEDGKFREDLLHRIYVFPITIPPLRDRLEDIVLYTKLFIRRLNEKMGSNKKITDSALEYLTEHFWPGNVRELKNTIERAYIISEDRIDKNDIYILKWKKDNPRNLQAIIDQTILETLIRNKFHKKKSYEELGISRSKLYRWIDDNSELLKGFDYE